MKFVVAGHLFPRPLSFPSAAAAAAHPLAARLFALDGVYNVFMVQDFVTINKRPDLAWEPLSEEVTAILMDYLADPAQTGQNQAHADPTSAQAGQGAA